jgi:hypothetical protein
VDPRVWGATFWELLNSLGFDPLQTPLLIEAMAVVLPCGACRRSLKLELASTTLPRSVDEWQSWLLSLERSVASRVSLISVTPVNAAIKKNHSRIPMPNQVAGKGPRWMNPSKWDSRKTHTVMSWILMAARVRDNGNWVKMYIQWTRALCQLADEQTKHLLSRFARGPVNLMIQCNWDLRAYYTICKRVSVSPSVVVAIPQHSPRDIERNGMLQNVLVMARNARLANTTRTGTTPKAYNGIRESLMHEFRRLQRRT